MNPHENPLSHENRMRGNIMVALVSVLAVIAVGVVLKLAASVFIPLVVAWFLLQISRPVILFGQKLKLPHVLNVVFVFIVIFLLCLVGIKFFASQIMASERLLVLYGAKLNELVGRVLELLQLPEDSLSGVSILRRYMSSISGRVFNFSSHFVMTLIFLMFMLLEIPVLDRKIDNAFSGEHAARIKLILESISQQASRYLRTMTLVSFITGVCIWAALLIIGVEFAAGWGILAFLLNFIPAVGSFIAVVPPVLMSLLQFSPDSPLPVITLLVLGAIQMTTGNILAPKLFGDRLGLSPVLIMLSLLFWSMLLGVPGAILSVPITSTIKIVCENIPSLRPIAIMMGTGREAAPSLPRKERERV